MSLEFWRFAAARSPLRIAAVIATIYCATFLAYLPALRGEFLWDDPGHVTQPALRSAEGLKRIWFEIGATQQYYPVLHTAFWIEHRCWGDRTTGYHVVNVVLHATAACLFAAFLRRLALPGAVVAALLFALHPVCVESVAWISEQKNTLSLVFYLAAALAYLRFNERRGRAAYIGATLLFILALLTKSVTATLPAALLVVLWFKHGKLSVRRDVVPLLPWFTFAVAAGAFTSWFERTWIGAQGDDFTLTFLSRCLLASRSICFYAGKLIWPADLMFIYPRWTIDAARAAQYVFPCVVFGALALLWRVRLRRRGPLAAALLFVGTLFPALGFIDVFPFVYSYVADHFQYLASLSFFALAGTGLSVALAPLPPGPARLVTALLILSVGTLTLQQSRIYRDRSTLYRATLEKNPSCWMAHNNLGELLLQNPQRVAEATAHFEAALRLRPGHANAHNNRGAALLLTPGRLTDAIDEYRTALRLRPDFPEAHYGLANALLQLPGRTPESIAHYRAALRLRPGFAEAHSNLGAVLAATPGRLAEAIVHVRTAVQLQPDFFDARYNLSMLLLREPGHRDEAIAHLQLLVQKNPGAQQARQALRQLQGDAPP